MDEKSVRRSFREYDIREEIVDVLIGVCPQESLTRYLHILPSIMRRISRLKELVNELGITANVGLTSHTIVRLRGFFETEDRFRDYTRDYIRRCCDLIEYLVKTPLATKLEVEVRYRPLGSAVLVLERSDLPKDLVEKLKAFNSKIYNPAKHEVPQEDRGMYSVADAVAVTFACLDLAKEINNYMFGAPRVVP